MSKNYFTLSSAQERVWHLNKLMSQNFGFEIFNIPYLLELEGNLDLELLSNSIHFLIQRHSALRTYITEINDEPVQKIANKVDFKLNIRRLENKNSSISNDEILSCIKEEINYAFNLGIPPLFRTTIIELGNDKYLLVFLFHHIISDEWSVGIFSRELSSLYTSYLNGLSPTLPKIESSYVNFSIWQKDWLSSESFKQQLCYWNKKLNKHHLFHIPFDHKEITGISEAGSYRFRIDQEQTKKLKLFSSAASSTLFITMLTIYITTLHKLYKQKDLLIVSPITNRHYEGVENIIGCFVNMVPVRNKIESGESFSDLLKRVKTSAFEAYDNQDIPFDILMENTYKTEGNEKYFPQLFYEMKTSSNYLLDLPEITTNWYNNLDIKHLFSKKNMNTKDNNFIDLEFEYSAELYDEETFLSLANNLIFIMKQVINDVDIKIQKISTLPKKIKTTDCPTSSTSSLPKLTDEIKIKRTITEKLNRYLKLSVKEMKLST